jgi:lysozyme family protein
VEREGGQRREQVEAVHSVTIASPPAKSIAPPTFNLGKNSVLLITHMGPNRFTYEEQQMEQEQQVDALIDALIEREGDYSHHPADRGGPTRFGITEAVARAHGYRGAMRALPREEAAAIYRRLYWLRPKFDQVAERFPRIAAELFDTGVNMGPAVAATFLQRALTALNRNARDFADLVPDGRIGPATLAALDGFLEARGRRGGETVLLRALEALQGERYLRLAERRPANEAFLYGWLANRIGTL